MRTTPAKFLRVRFDWNFERGTCKKVCVNRCVCVKVIDRSTYPWLRHERPGRAGELCVLSHRSGCIFTQCKQVTTNTSHTLASPLFSSPYRGDRFARSSHSEDSRIISTPSSGRLLAGFFAAMASNFQVSSWPDGLTADGQQKKLRDTLQRETVVRRDCS